VHPIKETLQVFCFKINFFVEKCTQQQISLSLSFEISISVMF
jgi:hypothetical protein